MAFLSSIKQIASAESSAVAQEFMPEFFKLTNRRMYRRDIIKSIELEQPELY